MAKTAKNIARRLTKVEKALKAKNKGGRPTKYKVEYCDKLIKFFDIEPWEERKIPHYKGGELVWTDIKILPVRMPTLRSFAKSIKVSIRAVYNWLNPESKTYHKEFMHAFTYAKDIRKDWLVDVGLSGAAPPASFKFVAVNVTDMRDRTEAEIGGKDGQPIQISIVDFAKINDDTK